MSPRMHRARVLAFAFASMTTAACGGAPSGGGNDTEGNASPQPEPTPAPTSSASEDGGASSDGSAVTGLALKGPIATATDVKGVLHVFYTTADSVLHTRVQTAPNASAPWGADQLVASATTKASSISAAVDGTGSIVLAYADESQVLSFTKQQAGSTTWSAPAAVAGTGTLALQVVVAANADGHLEIFYIDPTHLLFHTNQQGVGGPWEAPAPLTGAVTPALQIAVGTNADGRLDVFYVGTNYVLNHNPQTTPSGGWQGEDGLVTTDGPRASVAVGSSGNKLTVFSSRLSDGALYSMQQLSSSSLDGWTPEVALGTGYGPAVATQMLPVAAADGCLAVVYAGQSGVLYQQEEQCMTSGKWPDVQTPFASANDLAISFAVGTAADGIEQMFLVSGGASHFLFHASMSSNGWSEPEQL